MKVQKVPKNSIVPSKGSKKFQGSKLVSEVSCGGLTRLQGSKSEFQVRVPSESSIVPSKGSGLRVLSKFQAKLPGGSKVSK